jgi:hypothetical protein
MKKREQREKKREREESLRERKEWEGESWPEKERAEMWREEREIQKVGERKGEEI